MKKIRFFLIWLLIPGLIYGLGKKECMNMRNQAFAEWNRHNELVQEFNKFGVDQKDLALHRLRESLYDFVTHLDIVGKMRYGDELHIVEPHPDASFWDHEFLSPTFAPILKAHVIDYIRKYGGKK